MDMASAQLRRPLVRVLLSARARVAAPVRRCYATGAVPVPASGATAHKAAPPTASPVWHTPCRPLQNAMLHGSAASPALLASQQPRSTRAFSRSAPRQQQTRTVDFLLADVGEGITECEIVEWYVPPGTHVEEFDMLVLLQTDKATVEVTSRYKGTVVEHCYKVGEVARVGTPLCRIEMQGEVAAADQQQSQEEKVAERPAESSETAANSINDASAEAPMAAPSPRSAQPHPASDAATGGAYRSLAAPAVRRITRENNIDINSLRGTGRDGRVTKEDVQQHLASLQYPSATQSSGPPSQSTGPPVAEATVVPLSGTRKAMFRAMSATWSAPHFLYAEEIDVTALNKVRAHLQARLSAEAREGPAVKLTLLPFLIKAMSMVMDQHPLFRSTLDTERMELRQSEAHRFSMALASTRGLVTPALPGDVRNQSVLDVARNVAHLQQRGSSERGLSPADLGAGGATVTLSNIGSVGGTYTFPLLPPTGQLVIGGLGRARTLPRFDANDNIVKATVLTASFVADHRVVEGAELARFVDAWKRRVEDPSSWILEMR